MALEFDIEAKGVDEFSKSLEEAAEALQRIAKWETQINSQSRALGRAYENAATYGERTAKSERASLATSTKQAIVSKRETKEQKTRLDRIKEGAIAVGKMGAALVASTAAAAALAYKLLDAGKGAYDARREAGALLDAWTGQRGPKAIALIDGMAAKLGMRFEEARAKFLEFREAGLNNKLSFKLIKIRQDLIAMGLSAENADKEVARVTSVGHDPYARIRAINELQNAYKGVGTGAFAAYRALHSVEGAQVRLSNAVSPMLADFWKKVGPDIGDAANRLADFVINMLKSDEAKAVIDKVADSIKWLASQVTSENLTTGINVLRAGWEAVSTVFEVTGKMIAFQASAAVDAFEWLSTKASAAMDWLVDNFPDGAALIDGFVEGITSRVSAAVDSVSGVAKDIAGAFAKALGIQSPSKVFAEYGRQTIAGYERGQTQALGAELPLQRAARERPAMPDTPARVTGQTTTTVTTTGPSITIENLVVQGGANASADDVARSVRRELQLLLNAGALSRGYA